MDRDLRSVGTEELTVQHVVQRYSLGQGTSITLVPEGDHWRCAREAAAALDADGAADHAAEALARLLRFDQIPPIDRFCLMRLVPAPAASGERPVDDDGQLVVVGERVVVNWAREVHDIPYTAPVNLSQLAAVNFLGVPDTHGLLIWTTPSGHEAPIAIVTRYLPRAVNASTSLLSLLRGGPDAEPAEVPCLSARLGRITAALHVALSTRSRVLAEPTRLAAGPELVSWHERVRATIDRAALIAAEGTVPEVGPALLARLNRLQADAAALADAAGQGSPVVLTRVHGDLHTGRILRWAGGLMITGFGKEPACDLAVLGLQPPARDLARLLHSLSCVARLADLSGADGRCSAEWLPAARQRLLTAYRTELQVARRPELLDERLVAAFEAEHIAREVIEASRSRTSGPWDTGPCTWSA